MADNGDYVKIQTTSPESKAVNPTDTAIEETTEEVAIEEETIPKIKSETENVSNLLEPEEEEEKYQLRIDRVNTEDTDDGEIDRANTEDDTRKEYGPHSSATAPKLHAQPGTVDKEKRVENVERIIHSLDADDIVVESQVIARLYDRDQGIPTKTHTKRADLAYLNKVDPKWKYNITLGDLELREITHYDGKQETLWFPMEQYPNDYNEIDKSVQSKRVHIPPRKVFVALKVKRVSDVDNIAETFRMRFHMYFNWLPTEADYKDHYRAKKEAESQNNPQILADWEPKWYPHLEFQNMIEEHRNEWELYPEEGYFRVQQFKDFAKDKGEKVAEGQFDCEQARFLRVKKECEMTFAEELELQSFPFDCQDLSCIIHERTTGGVRCVFLPELRKPNFGSIDPRYSVIDEWDLETAILEFGDADPFASRSKSSYAMIVLRLKVKRRWKVFFFSVLLMMFCISVLALTGFSLSADEMGDRLSLLITLILTAVAFSFVLFNSLPNVPYLTFIDKYILGSYAFLVGLMVEAALIRMPGFTEDVDNYFMYITSASMVIYNIFFVCYGMYLRNDERNKLAYSSDEVEKEVNLSRPGIRFDYTQRMRSGIGGRLLSFVGKTHASAYMNEKQKAELEKKQSKMDTLFATQTTIHGYNSSEIPDSPAR